MGIKVGVVSCAMDADTSLRQYDYPRLTSPSMRLLAWITVSSFSSSLLLIPCGSLIAIVRTVAQLVGLAPWHNRWTIASVAVVGLSIAPGRKWPWMSEKWQRLFALWNQLFETKVVLPEAPSPKGAFILTVHPHGIIPLTGCMIWEATRRLGFAAPDYFGGASSALRIPLFRHFLLHNGGVPAGRSACKKVLKSGAGYSVFSGGITEMVLSKNSAEVLYVEKRRGVFELAHEMGDVPVIPLLAFGTTKHFGRWPDENDSFLTRLSRKLKASILLPVGWCGLPVPKWHPVTLVFGPAIDLGSFKNGDPVEAAHVQWVQWYREAYEKHSVAAGYGDRPLEIM